MPYKDPEKQKQAVREAEARRRAKNGTRHKVWTGIFYPDSAPPDWEDEMSDIHMRVWVSPPHDSDVWTANDERKNADHKAGTCKKTHYHYIAEYENPVDRDTFLSDFAFLRGTQSVKAVRSLRAMVRYLAHLDDPKKAQYDKNGIKTFGGADLDIVLQLGTHERHEMLREMRTYIRDNLIIDYCMFIDYCDDCAQEWSILLDDNCSYTIEKYIKSLRYRLKEFYPEIYDQIRYKARKEFTRPPAGGGSPDSVQANACQGAYADRLADRATLDTREDPE